MKFTLGERVRKIKGSAWQGFVVGTYRSSITREGYAVESEREKGSVQIYPADALEFAPPLQDNGTVEKCCNPFHAQHPNLLCTCPCHRKEEKLNQRTWQEINAQAPTIKDEIVTSNLTRNGITAKVTINWTKKIYDFHIGDTEVDLVKDIEELPLKDFGCYLMGNKINELVKGFNTLKNRI